MKRHSALHPLSREHHQALVLARRCERAQDEEARAAARALWRSTMGGFLAAHFQVEERELGGLLRHAGLEPELEERLRREHRELLDGSLLLEEPGQLERLGRLLREHVRWEERVLFPALERFTAPGLEEAAGAIEEGTLGAACALPPRGPAGGELTGQGEGALGDGSRGDRNRRDGNRLEGQQPGG